MGMLLRWGNVQGLLVRVCARGAVMRGGQMPLLSVFLPPPSKLTSFPCSAFTRAHVALPQPHPEVTRKINPSFILPARQQYGARSVHLVSAKDQFQHSNTHVSRLEAVRDMVRCTYPHHGCLHFISQLGN